MTLSLTLLLSAAALADGPALLSAAGHIVDVVPAGEGACTWVAELDVADEHLQVLDTASLRGRIRCDRAPALGDEVLAVAALTGESIAIGVREGHRVRVLPRADARDLRLDWSGASGMLEVDSTSRAWLSQVL